MSDVAVIVPARNAAATLPRTLAALEAQDFDGDFEVIVVDNGSTDATATLARASPVVTAVVTGGGAGPGPARDTGVAATSARYLAFTDSDCYPAPGWLRAGVAALGEADLVQGRVDPEPEVPRGPYDRTISVHGPYGLFESANLFLRRSLYEEVGGFGIGIPDPRKALAEDVFLGWRARRSGARTAFCEEALAHHAVFRRTARGFVAEFERLRHFPRIVREVPELRGVFLRHRWFLNRRRQLFDAAAAGVGLSVARRSWLPLVLTLPYLRDTYYIVKLWRGHHPAAQLAAAFVAADAVAAAALVRGSIAQRTPVL